VHEVRVLREALGLGESVAVNGIAKHAFIVDGLLRIGEAASKVLDGSARRVVAHATQGPCLQQNLVCVMEAGS
jgi:hypothetical protein